MRNHDRSLNVYPSLMFPEVYLLHGGYKEFFETNQIFCSPASYRPMLEPSFFTTYIEIRSSIKSQKSNHQRKTNVRKRKLIDDWNCEYLKFFVKCFVTIYFDQNFRLFQFTWR